MYKPPVATNVSQETYDKILAERDRRRNSFQAHDSVSAIAREVLESHYANVPSPKAVETFTRPVSRADREAVAVQGADE